MGEIPVGQYYCEIKKKKNYDDLFFCLVCVSVIIQRWDSSLRPIDMFWFVSPLYQDETVRHDDVFFDLVCSPTTAQIMLYDLPP